MKYLASNNIPFLVQNGGGGWAKTFNLGSKGVLINLERLNKVTFNAAKTQATIGGGASINDTIQAAYAAGTLVTTGNCNCVGALGAMLGGGYGNLVGLNGLGVDNIISLRVVTADGKIRTVTASSDPNLFWGLRGAGPNLGVVTSAVVKAYPAIPADLQAWTGNLIFTPDKLEAVIQAVEDLELKPDMNVFIYFISGGPPDNQPVVVLNPFLHKGTQELGEAAFASLYALGPVATNTAVLPYNQWNTGGDGFCTPGARKPSYGAGIQKLIPSVWRQVWNKYVAFQSRPGAEGSIVLLEAYSLEKTRSIDTNSAAFPFRNVNYHAVAIAWYNDKALDGPAQAFGQAARSLWRDSDNLSKEST